MVVTHTFSWACRAAIKLAGAITGGGGGRGGVEGSKRFGVDVDVDLVEELPGAFSVGERNPSE